MQVSATRTLSTFAATSLFLAGLFVFVIVLQVALVAGLRGLGVGGGASLVVSGIVILAVVMGASLGANALARRSRERLEAERARLALPEGACCVVWRPGPEGDFPWELEGQVAAVFPPVARRCGVEGYAVIDFEISADGTPKSFHCVDYWPSRIFYDSAAQALRAARFRIGADGPPRFGPSYRIPFVFRIQGAAQVTDSGRSAMNPVLYAVRQGLASAFRIGAAWGSATGRGLSALAVRARAGATGAAHGLADALEAAAAQLRKVKNS